MYEILRPDGTWYPQDLGRQHEVPIVQDLGRTPYEEFPAEERAYIHNRARTAPIRLYAMAEVAAATEPPNVSLLSVLHSIAMDRATQAEQNMAAARATRGLRGRRARQALPELEAELTAYALLRDFTLPILVACGRAKYRQQR